MSRCLNCGLVRNLNKFLQKKNITSAIYNPRNFISRGSKILIGSQICCAVLKTDERTTINIDGLRRACEEGDSAIIALMDQLKDFIIVVCCEYRSCMVKQIEITQAASNVGPLSEIWDEIPQYRTLADELSKELNEYMTVFNVIGQMTNDDSLISFVTGSTVQLGLVTTKYEELNMLLQKEFEQNREVELKLLSIKRDSILKS